MENLKNIVPLMIQFNAGDPKSIHHFMKAYSFAKAICEEEGITGDTANIIEIASLVHDIGIKIEDDRDAEYEGAHISDMLLINIGYPREVVSRVHYLVEHHKIYDDIDALDYQVLVEATFLVNAFDDKLDKESIKIVRDTVFKTNAGKKYLTDMFNIKD